MSTDQVKDYLKYYIGQKCQLIEEGEEAKKFTLTAYNFNYYREWHHLIKPELRRLSSITEEEVQQIAKMEGLVNVNAEKYKAWWQLQDDSYTIRICFWGEIELMKDGRICRLGKQFPITHYLLSRGFWLFGDEAFEKGLIIEKK